MTYRRQQGRVGLLTEAERDAVQFYTVCKVV